jgi:hypothetical protein
MQSAENLVVEDIAPRTFEDFDPFYIPLPGESYPHRSYPFDAKLLRLPWVTSDPVYRRLEAAQERPNRI